MKKLFAAVVIISFGLWSCGGGGGGKDDPPVAKTLCDSVTYTTFVKPIFTQHCNLAGCHSQGAGGIDLRTYAKAKDAATLFDMIKAINWKNTDANKNMPQSAAKLSQRKIDIITCWINKGFPE